MTSQDASLVIFKKEMVCWDLVISLVEDIVQLFGQEDPNGKGVGDDAENGTGALKKYWVHWKNLKWTEKILVHCDNVRCTEKILSALK
jgi:hypothetical protein